MNYCNSYKVSKNYAEESETNIKIKGWIVTVNGSRKVKSETVETEKTQLERGGTQV